jgi:hypothetical protein
MHIVDNTVARLPEKTKVSDIVDCLVEQQVGMSDCVVLYEKDGEIGWFSTEFDKWSEFIGFVEFAKLQIAHQAGHGE